MKSENQPQEKRRGWLKNGNQPGDFTKASRCEAKTRRGTPCQCPAMVNGRCRLHGGKSTGAPAGNRNALKTGEHTAEAKAFKKQIRELLRNSKNVLMELEGGSL